MKKLSLLLVIACCFVVELLAIPIQTTQFGLTASFSYSFRIHEEVKAEGEGIPARNSFHEIGMDMRPLLNSSFPFGNDVPPQIAKLSASVSIAYKRIIAGNLGFSATDVAHVGSLNASVGLALPLVNQTAQGIGLALPLNLSYLLNLRKSETKALNVEQDLRFSTNANFSYKIGDIGRGNADVDAVITWDIWTPSSSLTAHRVKLSSKAAASATINLTDAVRVSLGTTYSTEFTFGMKGEETKMSVHNLALNALAGANISGNAFSVSANGEAKVNFLEEAGKKWNGGAGLNLNGTLSENLRISTALLYSSSEASTANSYLKFIVTPQIQVGFTSSNGYNLVASVTTRYSPSKSFGTVLGVQARFSERLEVLRFESANIAANFDWKAGRQITVRGSINALFRYKKI